MAETLAVTDVVRGVEGDVDLKVDSASLDSVSRQSSSMSGAPSDTYSSKTIMAAEPPKVTAKSPTEPKRARKRTERTVIEPISYQEEKQMRMALDRSKEEVVAPKDLLPTEALTLRPSLQEWREPIAFVVKHRRAIHENGGIAKIVPPQGWACPLDLDVDHLEIATKEQTINTLGEGLPYGTGSDYDADGYREMAEAFHKSWKEKLLSRGEDINDLKVWERLYWRIVEGGERERVVVEYGNDVSTEQFGGGFPRVRSNERTIQNGKMVNAPEMWEPSKPPDFSNREYYARSEWNLANIARARGSVLGNIQDAIDGINVPWLYFGMLFSTFSWHVEDNWFYSINYNHAGGVKLWYGVSPLYQIRFDQEMKKNMPVRFQEDPDLLNDITTMLHPSYLISKDIPVVYIHQHPGEFVVTLPGAYHGGFSLGFNIGEAVNFAPIDWIPSGRLCRDFYRSRRRKPVIAHEKIVWSLVKHRQSMSAADLSLLHSELSTLLKVEKDTRAHCEKDGIIIQVRLPDEDDASDESDMRRPCTYCEQPCSLHAVVCSCSPTKTSCGSHQKSLCSCHPRRKSLVVWKSLDELQAMVECVKQELDGRV